MNNTELVAALRKSQKDDCVECGYKNGCDTYGCQLMGIAADTIAKYDSAIKSIEEMYCATNTMGKYYLRDVLKLFKIYMPPIPDPRRMVYDFEICSTKASMIRCLNYINNNLWTLISVTYGPNGYTLFFRRPARE